MADLRGVDLDRHLDTIFSEWKTRKSIYGCPERQFFRGTPDLDFSVRFHDRRAFTPIGPSAGPHTQLAQNILLSFLCGGRIMELKTIQILDELAIPRPCIDARNVCYNVEWSQELKLADSYREYVHAWILLKILEETERLGRPKGDPFYEAVFDLSVGYDVKGISTSAVTEWIRKMMNAEAAIAEALGSLPQRYDRFKQLPIDPRISGTVTVSTFHGCPKDEIEAIGKYLIEEFGLHVIIKLNPTLLGYDIVRQTLCDDLGYEHLQLDPKAFKEDLAFDDGVALMKRLRAFGVRHGKNVGAKFTNTLVVKNHGKVFRDKTMYLSGRPLHVLSMQAMQRFREEIGDEFPISFSAGIERSNLADAVACNMVPVTICSDLLKKGGYTRMTGYLRALGDEMRRVKADTLPTFIQARAADSSASVAKAGGINSEKVVPQLVTNPRYHFGQNSGLPKSIDRTLGEFDCITCDLCILVCPNGAILDLPVGEQKLAMTDLRNTDGKLKPAGGKTFELSEGRQIVILSDYCNECGNCETFCPEKGAPFLAKPHFFLGQSAYDATNTDGFCFQDETALLGRIGGEEYRLQLDAAENRYRFASPKVEVFLDLYGGTPEGRAVTKLNDGEMVDMRPFYVMRAFLESVRRHPMYLLKLVEDGATRARARNALE